MAKKIYTYQVLLGIVIAVSGCSQEDLGREANSVSGRRIEFNASLPEVSSRATELKASSIKEIEVSSFTVGESSETPYFVNKTF
ncbi:MAG: hypothetical protein K2J46_01140, partial [Muribaculaceae bacterium]|nr:hypothetical protein [Muribaculaceae bacterium]